MSDEPQVEPHQCSACGGAMGAHTSECQAHSLQRPCSTIPDSRPPNTEGWWCDNCKCVVPGEMVTYDETHDSRYGGCGGPVSYNDPR